MISDILKIKFRIKLEAKVKFRQNLDKCNKMITLEDIKIIFR